MAQDMGAYGPKYDGAYGSKYMAYGRTIMEPMAQNIYGLWPNIVPMARNMVGLWPNIEQSVAQNKNIRIDYVKRKIRSSVVVV
jgi:hypothetical protein